MLSILLGNTNFLSKFTFTFWSCPVSSNDVCLTVHLSAGEWPRLTNLIYLCFTSGGHFLSTSSTPANFCRTRAAIYNFLGLVLYLASCLNMCHLPSLSTIYSLAFHLVLTAASFAVDGNMSYTDLHKTETLNWSFFHYSVHVNSHSGASNFTQAPSFPSTVDLALLWSRLCGLLPLEPLMFMLLTTAGSEFVIATPSLPIHVYQMILYCKYFSNLYIRRSKWWVAQGRQTI